MYERQKAKLKELFHADANFGQGEILQELRNTSVGLLVAQFFLFSQAKKSMTLMFSSVPKKMFSMLSTLVLVSGISQNGLPQLLTLSESLFSLFTRTPFLP